MRVLQFAALTRSTAHPLRLNAATGATPAALMLSYAARLNTTTAGSSSSSNSSGDEIRGTEEETANTAAPKRKRFTATVNFKISPEKVDSDNCPSASEIKEMLPTAAELYEQLPTTAEVRKMYDLDRPGAGRAPPTPEIYASQGVMASLKRTVLGALSKESDLNDNTATNSGKSDASTTKERTSASKGFEGFLDRFSLHPEATTVGPHAMSKPTAASAGEDEALWPDCDTPEDILNEERFGGEGDEAPKPTGEHVVLAWKALLYGTVLATVVTAFCGLVMCWYMGFSSFAHVKEHLQTRKEREIERLKEEARRQKKEEKRDGDDGDDSNIDDDDVHVYEIDLTQPSTLMEQVNGLVKLIEDLAAAEAEKENTINNNNNNNSSSVPRGVEVAPASGNNSFAFIDMRSAGDKVEEESNPLRPTKRSYSL